MRALLAERVGPERARDGVAESLPLADASQRAVTVADGFHWLDGPRALAEFARVLAPGGGLALLATHPNWSGTSWGHELGMLLSEARPEHPYFDGPGWAAALAAAGWSAPREIELTVSEPARPELIGDYMLSMSWVAALDEDARAELLARAEALVRDGETPDELPFHFRLALSTPARGRR